MAILFVEHVPPGAGKGDLLRLLDELGGLEGRRVGQITLSGGTATIEVPAGWESRLAQSLDGATLKGRKIRARAGREADITTSEAEHFDRLLRWVELEREAEADRARERAARRTGAAAERGGESLVDLVITDEEPALAGRYAVTLVKRQRTPLPWTRIDVGSPVVLSGPRGGKLLALRGIVEERRPERIKLSLPGLPDEAEEVEVWRVDLSSDEISSQRQRLALERARSAAGDRLAQLSAMLCGASEPRFDDTPDEQAVDAGLNEAQLSAVDFALSARDIALVHGPPGTGKTRTVVEFIRRAVRRGDRVLACGPSNMAVDNMLARLAAAGERVVRLGQPARVLSDLRTYTLDALVDRHEDVRLARKLAKDAFALFRRAARTTRAKPQPGARREMREEARALLSDARRLEAQAVEHILDTADVVCATSTGLDDSLLGARQFSCLVIDEACQATEAGCWPPIVRAERIVLAGDHRQLPPTILNDLARREGFAVSLFERLAQVYPQSLRALNVQYRMHRDIMEFPSGEFYENTLVADPQVADHRLSDLCAEAADSPWNAPLEFIDTAGAGYDEQIEPDGESRFNQKEAELACSKARGLVALGMSPADIGIITPYAAQARHIADRLGDAGIEIDSVDGFQGREKEAIIISLVRSNPRGEIGFLADIRRMNVAMTRARRKLIIIGDSATLAANEFYGRLVAHCEARGFYRTVWELDAAE
ncbi:MAG TPA: AAA domain-containing protein [Pirellulales bacterium]|jgi:ATP-dependent RNA/DNA helicase IGHMBP2|nr:AAA domain-containing protein [Pirellulales bacterium]